MGRRMKLTFFAAAAALSMTTAPLDSANAQFFGGVVYDPTNHTQNILTAARTLQMINNQIKQLTNEAQIIANQAKNLTQLPYTARVQLQARLTEIDTLIQTANSITYDVASVDAVFASLFPEDYSSFSNVAMSAQARTHWEEASRSLHDAMLMQAKIAETIKLDMTTLDEIVATSDTAVGDLQVNQAGNQLYALQVKQSMQASDFLAVQHRAEALERARQLQAEERARVHRRRFIGDGTAYTPS